MLLNYQNSGLKYSDTNVSVILNYRLNLIIRIDNIYVSFYGLNN